MSIILICKFFNSSIYPLYFFSWSRIKMFTFDVIHPTFYVTYFNYRQYINLLFNHSKFFILMFGKLYFISYIKKNSYNFSWLLETLLKFVEFCVL